MITVGVLLLLIGFIVIEVGSIIDFTDAAPLGIGIMLVAIFCGLMAIYIRLGPPKTPQ